MSSIFQIERQTLHASIGAQLVVRPTDKSFDYWLSREFISASARQELESANLLITPRMPPPGYGDPNFISGTVELLKYCKQFQSEGLEGHICRGDLDHREIELASYDVFLPDVIVERVIIPIYVKVMSGYITDKLRARFGNEIHVHAKVTIVDKERNIATEFSYRGKAADYETTVVSTLALIETSADLKLAGETEDCSVEERIERLSNRSIK